MCEMVLPTLPARLLGSSGTGSLSGADNLARDAGREKSFRLPLSSKVKIEGRLFAVFNLGESLDVDALRIPGVAVF